MEAMKHYEHEYEHLGYLCGIDEVEEAACQSVVACAVILPKDHDILYLNDSKN